MRKTVFVNENYYHVFNRGIERRPTFTNVKEFSRAKELLYFYQFKDLPLKYSQLKKLPIDQRTEMLDNISKNDKLVEIICYCFMPNHFHFLLRQKLEKGIATFVANFTNAYTKYFNIRHEREGSLFQGVFKAVFVETEEQLLHLSRYIHLNPVASSLIHMDNIDSYRWSSYPEYLAITNEDICEKQMVLDFFKSVTRYTEFVKDHADYAKELDKIKHLHFD